MSNFSAPGASWSDVARLCRRVCVLRERGQTDEAEKIRAGELDRLVAALRTPADSDAAINERLNSIFAIESERVANAAVLAELLAPMLASPASIVPDSPRAEEKKPLREPSAPPPPPRRDGAISIADFIDEMIAQETPPPERPTARRAS